MLNFNPATTLNPVGLGTSESWVSACHICNLLGTLPFKPASRVFLEREYNPPTMSAILKRAWFIPVSLWTSHAWHSQLLARTHQNVVVLALANKLVRMAWAVLCKNERYRAPVLAITT
jgi:hypothetical protein